MSASPSDVIVLEEGDTDLPSTVTILRSSTGARAYIIGTAHVSQESCDEVADVLRRISPARVLVELCKSRTSILTLTREDLKPISFEEFMASRKRGDPSSTLKYLLGSVTQHVSEQLDVLPGAEFRVAHEYAQEYKKDLYFIDRPVNVTLSRTWTALSPYHKLKLIVYILYSIAWDNEVTKEEIELLKSADLLSIVMGQLKSAFPTLVDTIITERDQFLAYNIRENLQSADADVVAVVGMGHVKGIKEHWEKEIDMKGLMLPVYPRQPSFPWFKLAGVAVVTGLGYWWWSRR